jgi:hypothetical protein
MSSRTGSDSLEKKNTLLLVRIEKRLLEYPVFSPVKSYDLAIPAPSSLLLLVDLALEIGGIWKSHIKGLVRENEVNVISAPQDT